MLPALTVLCFGAGPSQELPECLLNALHFLVTAGGIFLSDTGVVFPPGLKSFLPAHYLLFYCP